MDAFLSEWNEAQLTRLNTILQWFKERVTSQYNRETGEHQVYNPLTDTWSEGSAANYLLQDGSRSLTANWDIGDTRKILADEIRARDGAGLKLFDDGGNGIFVEDGGDVYPSHNIVMADGKWIGLGSAKARIIFSDTPFSDIINFALPASWVFGSTLDQSPHEGYFIITSTIYETDFYLRTFSDTLTEKPYLALQHSHSDIDGTMVTTLDNEVLGRIRADGVDASATPPIWATGAYIQFIQNGAIGGGDTAVPTDIEFYTSPGGSTAPLLRMILDKDGKVGIGTGTPATSFELVSNLNYTAALLRLSYSGFASNLNIGFGFSDVKSPGYPIGGSVYLSPTIWFQNGANINAISYGVYDNWDCYGDWEQHGAMRGYPLITAGPGTGAPIQFRSDLLGGPPHVIWGEINFVGDDEVFDFSHGIRALDAGIDVSPAITLNSIFEVNGAEGLAIETVTGNTTLDVTHSTLLVNASGNVVITLPTAASAYNSTDGIGRIYEIKKIDADADTVTVDGNGAELIDGAATAVLTVQWESITLQSNGTAWYIL